MLSPRPPELGKTQAELAKELGVTPQAVSGWIHGRGRPSPRLMKQLEESSGIPMRDWLEPQEPEDAAEEPSRTGTEHG